MKDTSWIVVANGSRCRVFEQPKRFGPLEELSDLVSTRTRLHGRDIDADRPGRAFDSYGEGRHALAPSVDPNEQETIRFAKQIAAQLESARTEQRYRHLYLIAEPQFLGHLRAALSRPALEFVAADVDKDWTQHDANAIREKLRDTLLK